MWVAGFEVLFFQAGVVSLLARLVGDRHVAVAAAVVLRCSVTAMQLSAIGIESRLPFLATGALATAAGGLLFVYTGLPAPMLLAAALCARLFF